MTPLYETAQEAPGLVLLTFSIAAYQNMGSRAAEAFGLTSAEWHVATLLMGGFELREIGAIRKTAVNTVRAQLKQLFQKTHTRRQGELVARLQAYGRP